MHCPSCKATARKGSSFCSYCGQQLPVVVGESFPYGIRFPAGRGPAFAVALSHARQAPVYSVRVIEGARFHVALYDRLSLSALAELHRLVFMALPGDRPLVEHTIDGRHFFTGPSFWACLARRVAGRGVEYPEFPHPDCRCHSFFGCIAAQRRQHEMYHREGWEVFYHGRHGSFGSGLSQADEDFIASGRATRSEIVAILGTSSFVLDRAKVKAEVLAMVERAGAHRCPLFSRAHLEKQLRKLPGTVLLGLPDADPSWGFLNCAIHGPAVFFRCYGELTA